MNLIPVIQKHAEADRQQRFRDTRAFYASSALSCLRDQYWSAIGEPSTNPPDMLGKMKMMVGSAIEAGIVKEFFSDLHWYGVGLLGTQVPVGGSNPNWDGYLDALVYDQKTKQKYVIELKTKSGFGADILHSGNSNMGIEPFVVSDEYLAQLGLYLKDLSEKGVTNEGCLMYVLLSDNHFGKLLQISCRYEEATKEIVAYRGACTDGVERELDQRLNIGKILDRWAKLQKLVAEKKCPPGEYKYKYQITRELLEKQSDATLRKMLQGQKVLGDWQVIYSRYFNKQLEVDGIERGYTTAELKQIQAYYKELHPKSKL